MSTYITIAQAAKMIGKSTRQIYRMIADGRLTAYKDGTGARTWLDDRQVRELKQKYEMKPVNQL